MYSTQTNCRNREDWGDWSDGLQISVRMVTMKRRNPPDNRLLGDPWIDSDGIKAVYSLCRTMREIGFSCYEFDAPRRLKLELQNSVVEVF